MEYKIFYNFETHMFIIHWKKNLLSRETAKDFFI